MTVSSVTVSSVTVSSERVARDMAHSLLSLISGYIQAVETYDVEQRGHKTMQLFMSGTDCESVAPLDVPSLPGCRAYTALL